MPDLKTKVKVGPAGQEAEYEVVIPGVTPDATVSELFMPKAAFEPEMKRRVSGIITNEGYVKVEELDKLDEPRKAKALEVLGIKPGTNDGKPASAEQIAEAVNKAKQGFVTEFTEREVKPLKTKLSKAEARVQTLTRQSLRSDLLTYAAANGVKEEMLRATTPGTLPPIVAMLEPLFGYAEDAESWFAREGTDSFRLAPTPTAGRLHMNVEEAIKDWVGNKANAPFVNSQAQGGPGLNAGPGRSEQGSKDVFLTHEQAIDGPTYEAARAQAAKQGGQVRVRQAQQA